MKITIKWGEWETESRTDTYEFATEAERDAFLLGVDEACGWMDYEVVEDDGASIFRELADFAWEVVNEPKPKPREPRKRHPKKS